MNHDHAAFEKILQELIINSYPALNLIYMKSKIRKDLTEKSKLKIKRDCERFVKSKQIISLCSKYNVDRVTFDAWFSKHTNQ